MTVVALVPTVRHPPPSGIGAPTAWSEVRGKPLLWLAVAQLKAAGVDRAYVAVAASDVDRARELLGDSAIVVVGGKHRVASVGAALQCAVRNAERRGRSLGDVLLVHDAARAFVPVGVIRRVIDAVRAGSGAVIPVLPVVDTIRQLNGQGRVAGVVDRNELRVVQTPQGFAPDVLQRAHRFAVAQGITDLDDAGLAEAIGETVTTVAGDADSFTVTTLSDLSQARRRFGGSSSAASSAASSGGSKGEGHDG